MPNGLTPQVVDIPLLLPNQTPPRHAGPLGRLGSMLNAQIKHFLPSSQTAPQRIEVLPRDGFTALSSVCRDSATGGVVTGDWNNPELLAPLGNQLLSICDSIPRVNNGTDWTNYSASRVVTNQLSEDVLHTTNHTLQASDSAYLNGVTCFTWTETTQVGPVILNTSMVSFRADDGAWVRTPSQLFQNASGNAMARVVSDGAFFWVIFNAGTHLAINVYDTHGAQVATDASTVPMSWTAAPGYWDIAAFTPGGIPFVLIAQPDGFSAVGANVGVRVYRCTIAGSVITITNSKDVSVSCTGPVAFMTTPNPSTNTSNIIVTVGTSLFSVEYNGGFATHFYAFGAVLAGSGIPDSLTGWMDLNGGTPIAHVAYSLLSNFSPPAGPANDPGLRYVRSYACTRAGAVTLTTQSNNVLLQSRAFPIDQDWYAATYYQSGQGNGPSSAPQVVTPSGTLDYFTGASTQPVKVQPLDFATGGANVPLGSGVIPPTQQITSIAHTAGDQVALAGGGSQLNWAFVVAPFIGAPSSGTSPLSDTTTFASAMGSILHVAGCANPQNNGDWFVLSVSASNNVTTEPISLQGNAGVNESFAGGVTASLTQVWPVILPQDPSPVYPPHVAYPDVFTASSFVGGTATIAGASGVNVQINGTYSIFRFYPSSQWRGFGAGFFIADPKANILLLTKTSGVAGVAGTPYFLAGGTNGLLTITPALANAWALTGFSSDSDTRAGINVSLVVSGAHQLGNNGSFPETSNPMPGAPYGRVVDVTGAQAAQRAELFTGPASNLPTIVRNLTDPAQVMLLHINAITFDPSYLNATVVLAGLTRSEDNKTSYQITALAPWIDTHTVVLSPIDGHTGQTLYNFVGTETVTITKVASAGSPAFQPCWYLTPLSVSQAVAGRWEWSIAYADWRFDGATVAGGTFERNGYPLALASVVNGPTGKQLTLPYRAQSFTAGQVVTGNTGGVIGVQSTAESTVGLKLFTLGASPGQASVNSGEMFLPGAQASAFSASGFTEHGINLGPEKPFYVSQGVSANALALTVLATYIYVFVWEVTSESGDRVWSVTSPALSVTLTGANNKITIGGRMPGPTMRVVGVSGYRTANTGNPPTPTIQHYKITNDLAVNGPGFTFSSVNGGAASDTWQFVDEIPDQNIFSAQTLYTDQGFLQRFPAPAHRQSVGSWENRTWVIGYDGAVWMSGEKDEGDDVWFHPAFRYVLPTDDKPVALAAMENYLLVFCSRSIWFIPAVQFPDATGAGGSLPTPQPLPFRNGCTGFAQTVKSGVAYSSTAGGVWLINRSLQNLYLSQPVQDDLAPLTITGMAIDGSQRLVVVAGSNNIFVFDDLSQAWLRWTVSGATAQLVTTWQGNAVYQDSARVRGQVPGTFADITDGVATGVSPTIELALMSFGTVKGLKHCWAFNITGQVLGTCQIWAQLSYPDDTGTAPTLFGPFAVTAGVLNVEINPMVEEATSFDLVIFGTFVGVSVPGASYSLELITAEVGVESTMAKRPNSSRIPGA